MYRPWKIVVHELTLTVSLMFLGKSCLQEREKQTALYFHVLWDVLFGAVETIVAMCKYFLVYFLCQYHHLRWDL